MSTESSSSSTFPLLVGTKDYLRWAQNAEAELMVHNCNGALLPATPTTREAAVQHFASIGFGPSDITNEMTSTWMMKKSEREEKAEANALKILRKLVAPQNREMTLGKSAHEIWNALRNKYKDLSPWYQTEAIRKAYLIHMSDFASVNLYCNAFLEIFDEMCGMLMPDSLVQQGAIECILYGALLANVTEGYMPLVASLRTAWTTANTNLNQACIELERYGLRVRQSVPTIALTPSAQTTLHVAGSCDFSECVKAGRTNHPGDRCWRKDPSLRPKWLLKKMSSRGKLKKEGSSSPAPPDITS